MKHLKLTVVGLVALTAAAPSAFAFGPPGGPPMRGPPGFPGGGLPGLPGGGSPQNPPWAAADPAAILRHPALQEMPPVISRHAALQETPSGTSRQARREMDTMATDAIGAHMRPAQLPRPR